MVWPGVLVLFTGAILTFAIDGELGPVDVGTLGIVTMILGAGLLIPGLLRLNRRSQQPQSRPRQQARPQPAAHRGAPKADLPQRDVPQRDVPQRDVPQRDAARRGAPLPDTVLRDRFYQTGKGKIFAMVAAVIYILSPIDIVPDFLLPFGVIDDASAFTWLLVAIGQEMSRHRRRRKAL
jgi:uncharacterized membrane protein YkvA (DUF1232 family)